MVLSLSSCDNSSDDDSVTDEELEITSTTNPLDGMGEVEVVASGTFNFTEGPVWNEASESIFFTDIAGNTIYSLDVNTEELSVLRSSSNSANGFLLAAEQGTRIISRMDLLTNEVIPYIESVTLDGEDRLFNSPNDMTVHSNGTIYFTDPSFGLGDNESETGFNGFYVRKVDGTVELLRTFEFDTGESPNGVILSPNEDVLYLAVSYDESTPILAYDVDADGNLSNEREFAEGQNSDGMAIDEDGNLYVVNLEGINVWSENGDYWGVISLPGDIRTTNVTFGTSALNTLYITNRSSDIYAVELNVIGHQ